MADVNAPSGQAPAIAPPVHTDDQILPRIREEEGHSDCDPKHSVHQANYSSPSYEAQREVFKMPIPGSLITADIQEASYYQEYLANVAKHRRYLAGEIGSNQDSPASKPTKPARKPKSTAPKAPPRPAALEESMKTAYAPAPRGPLPPVVIREPESGKYQLLPEVQGKGKEKVTEEQVAHDLLILQKPKRKIPADQYIFQRRVSEPIGSSGHDETPYVVLGQSDSEGESEKVVLRAGEGVHLLTILAVEHCHLGFAAVLAVLKPERLKADRARNE
nr:hypothetical protein [Tanacetum cinerariifolium]